jgi:hypothetical protein
MADEQNRVRDLYKRLVAFYPREFKGQLGESMEQTFDDLYKEKRQSKTRSLGFILWTFIETAFEIGREHVLLLAQGGSVKNIIFSNPKSAALVAFLFTLPFMVLNTIAGNQIEPFYTIFKVNTGGGFWDHPVGHISLIVSPASFPSWRDHCHPPHASKNRE